MADGKHGIAFVIEHLLLLFPRTRETRAKTSVSFEAPPSASSFPMRPSLFLAILGFVGNFAYGFSSPPRPVSTFPRPLPSNAKLPSKTSSRGGAMKAMSSSDSDSSSLRKMSTLCSSIWGTTGVVYILVKAIRRVLPIALEPFLETATPLSSFQLG
jgi:hypothetical protein